MKNPPPKHALKFLRWFCREEFVDEIEGDLIELYEKDAEQSPRLASWYFTWQVLLHFRPDFIKSSGFPNPLMGRDMFRHNLLVSYRSFLRDKTSFFINLMGLSSGLICVLLIFLWVNDELSYDKFHENENRLYQVYQHFRTDGKIFTWEYSPLLLAEAMSDELPEVEASTSTNNHFYAPKGLLSDGENYITTEGIYAQENFFEVFSFELLRGDKSTVLSNEHNIAISEELALKLFKSKDRAIGKSLRWKTELMEEDFQVSGVFETTPHHSTKQFDVVIHMQKLIDADEHANKWNGDYGETYLVLKEGVDIEKFNQKIADFYEGKTEHRKRSTLFAKKYSDKYLQGNYEEGKLIGGRIEYVKIFSVIALFILLIACVNFMNLSTAQASKKVKEVGVKKTIGATRGVLAVQFFSASVLMVLLSIVVALVAVGFVLPYFNELTAKELRLSFAPSFLFFLFGILVLTALLSGSYPALYLSRFNPIKVLKGIKKAAGNEQWIRKGLVVFQFVLSTLFIIGVLVVHEQMKYIQTINLGYDRDNILCFERPVHKDEPELFLAELKAIAGVVNASNMEWTILSGEDSQAGFQWGADESQRKILFQSPRVGYDVIQTLGMEVLTGRSFSRERKDDFNKIIINESAQELMGLKYPVGEKIRYGSARQAEIIGVVKDFQYGSVHKSIEPLIMRFRNDGRTILVKINAGSEMSTIDEIKRIFKKYHPENSFHFSFMDDDYQKLYESENKVAVLSKIFSLLAVIISCLGLFGLAAFTAERRAKEIGLRKILGASNLNTVILLSLEFTKLIITGILVAIPVSYFFTNNWLNNFAYRIDVEWWYFALAAMATFLIAGSTVGYQTYRAATMNPVEALKVE